jgi:hypothetical protein
MEVFAAMLQERDTMRVYYMSDYLPAIGGNVNAPPRVTIYGSEPASERVSRIRNTVTRASNTPFDPVIKAYNDLRIADADDKWLVVLSDGGFNFINGIQNDNFYREVNGFLNQYANESNVNIILLAIGEDDDLNRMVRTINPNPGIGYFFDHARNSTEILGKITSICNRIFNRNILRFSNESRYEFNFDIPMTELLVFAQGPNVRISGIKGNISFSPNETVNVRYSEVPAIGLENNPNVIISRNLTGVIASFRNIPKGRYSIDVTGAQTVEIYYKPDANLAVKLFNGRREVRSQSIEEGDYQIRFGIVNERGEFFESELLGTVTYTATVRNDGREFKITNGETVALTPGEFIIDVKAQFLDINTSESMYNRQVTRKLTPIERFLEWVKNYWWVLAILCALLLYWLLWGTKKRFPRYMSDKPEIKIETDSSTLRRPGSFKKDLKTIWLPLCPEKGIITAAANGKLPRLEVKAVDGESMELMNTIRFTPDKLGSSVEFYINNQPLPEKSSKNRMMSCTAQIKSVFYETGVVTTHTCSFTRRNKKRKK